jgi:16S rRNA (cytosine967-C5)-methyltransferase
VQLIAENAARLRLKSIEVMAADGRFLPSSYHNSFDYLLLDAPCSGLGVLGQRADARWRKEAADSVNLSELAYELLLAAADYLKPGGVLLYSTCTVMPAENELNIERFLSERTDFCLSPMNKLAELLPVAADKEAALSGMLQLLPQRQGLEGFFYARLKKI